MDYNSIMLNRLTPFAIFGAGTVTGLYVIPKATEYAGRKIDNVIDKTVDKVIIKLQQKTEPNSYQQIIEQQKQLYEIVKDLPERMNEIERQLGIER